MTLRPHAVLIGVAVSYLLQVGGGYLAATQGIVRDPGAELGGDFSVLPILPFGTIFLGGYLSGRLAGVAGFINGIAVSVATIRFCIVVIIIIIIAIVAIVSIISASAFFDQHIQPAGGPITMMVMMTLMLMLLTMVNL